MEYRRILGAWFGVIAVLGSCPGGNPRAEADVAASAPPLVISKGGSYTGNFESQDLNVPVVEVATAEPVVLRRMHLRGKGTLIRCTAAHAHVTVWDCIGTGLNPDVAGTATGRFFAAENPDEVVLANNELNGTGGIYVLGCGAAHDAKQTISILRNRAHNIDGRYSDGKGGYRNDAYLYQFVQLDKVRRTPQVEIAWNEVINDPGASRVEDNINIYLSSGTPASPIRIHDNYIQGAYPADPATDGYSGGGILLGDGDAATPDEAPAFVEAYDNQVVSTTNYGIAIASGHDLSIYRNRILASGLLPDGRPIHAQNVGCYIWDIHGETKKTPSPFFNDEAHDNFIGWMKEADGKPTANDCWFPNSPDSYKVNDYAPTPITRDMETAEFERWKRKTKDARVVVGADAGSTAGGK